MDQYESYHGSLLGDGVPNKKLSIVCGKHVLTRAVRALFSSIRELICCGLASKQGFYQHKLQFNSYLHIQSHWLERGSYPEAFEFLTVSVALVMAGYLSIFLPGVFEKRGKNHVPFHFSGW